ncbi:hypothetical protein HYU06_02270 [Candidatus Woesearchaeota archaeon]|nr:hypothetical protein [Candidatus Woesearchaeota archaeon]
MIRMISNILFNKKLYVTVLALALIFLVACSSYPYKVEEVDTFAKCLTEKGVKYYGAFWCSNCAKQNKMLGTSKQYINYIECDPRCTKDDSGKLPAYCGGNVGNPELCIEKKVEKYPDFEFADGSRLVGVQQFETLAAKTGCIAPQKAK